MLVVISNALLYPAFALLMGGLLLNLISEKYRPTIKLTSKFFVIVLISIVLLTAVPPLSLMINIANVFNISFFEAVQRVLFTFNIGQVWILTVVVTTVLMIVMQLAKKQPRVFGIIAFVLAMLLIFTVSKASHSASLQPTTGLIGHSIHFLSASIWVGILFVVGLFAKDERNWPAFLKWYTPTAVVCVLLLTGSGLFLMKGIVPEYTNSFMLSYGQLILVKHLLFLLVILYGFINGFVIKRRLKRDATFHPKKWLRLESIFLLLTFIVTALMTEQAPPHNVALTLERVEPSAIFQFFTGSVGPYSQVVVTSRSSYLMIFAFVMVTSVLVIFYSAIKSSRLYVPVISSFIILVSAYFLIMLSVDVENTFETEGQHFPSVEEAIRVGHEDDDQLVVLKTGIRYENMMYVVYAKNEAQLISELLYESEQGYERIFDSRLTIGGVPISEAEHKIRTFLITDGPWLQQGKPFTYVTFGFIREPEEVFSVEIQYEGKQTTVPVENNSFFNVSASVEQWEALHPIIFFNQDGEEIGGYMRQFMETDAFCH